MAIATSNRVFRLRYAIATSVLLNAILTFGLRGSMFALFLVVALIVFFSVLLYIGGNIVRLVEKAPGPFGGSAGPLIVLGVLGLTCLLSLPLGDLLRVYDVDQAKRYCDQLRPEIERFCHEKGRCPTSLDDVRLPGRLPWLLKDRDFLRVGPGGYYFSFHDPAAFGFGEHVWPESLGQWIYED